LDELRKVAAKETKEFKSVILRYMQVEFYLGKHLKNIQRKNLKKANPK